MLEGAECYSASFTGFGADARDNDIRIENKRAGAGVHITGDRPLMRFGYWSIRTVVAPEPYIDLKIEPGQQFTWTYTYDYYTTSRVPRARRSHRHEEACASGMERGGVYVGRRMAASAFAQSESAGVNQYFTNCASCHESSEPGHQAPQTAVLKKMTPERILEVMTTGSMRNAAASLSDQDKRLIAEWVGGRKLDADLVGAAEKMPNACASHPQVRESNAPAWNGWGVDYRNSRFQPGAAAGLSPGQVSRLQLKWAFGFPGATALYGQTVYDGRLYVTSNAGYVVARRGDRMPALGLPRAVGGAERVHHRPAQQDGSAARHLLRRHPWHGVRLSASTGEEMWKTLTDPHPLALITGTPVLFEGRLFVPVASLEEPESGQADYARIFRGYMSALDAATGRQIWKMYTIPEVPKVVAKNSRGKDMLEPAGAGVWATPTLDVKRRALSITTGPRSRARQRQPTQ